MSRADNACSFCTFLNERVATICMACGKSLGLPLVNLTFYCKRSRMLAMYFSESARIHRVFGMWSGYSEVQNGGYVHDNDMDVLGQLCPICYCTITKEFKMPGCSHTFCVSCTKQHFSIKIMEHGINNFRCPIDTCHMFDELPNKSRFFNDLKVVLHGIVDAKTSKVFMDKIAILDIMDKPGFVRCSQCNHGFINCSKSKLTYCPSCHKTFCSKCGKKWTDAHSQLICKGNGQMDGDASDLQLYTNATCPQCKYKYFLERGGCMHIICSQCSYEYCEFCFKNFTVKGKKCNFPNCNKGQSLHAHQPRNCMYYVREMEHKQLEKLLKANGVRYNIVQTHSFATCPVKLNVEKGGIWVESQCKVLPSKSYNNMCLNHYKWSLCELMQKHSIDPVDVMNNLACVCELTRNNKQLPKGHVSSKFNSIQTDIAIAEQPIFFCDQSHVTFTLEQF